MSPVGVIGIMRMSVSWDTPFVFRRSWVTKPYRGLHNSCHFQGTHDWVKVQSCQFCSINLIFHWVAQKSSQSSCRDKEACNTHCYVLMWVLFRENWPKHLLRVVSKSQLAWSSDVFKKVNKISPDMKDYIGAMFEELAMPFEFLLKLFSLGVDLWGSVINCLGYLKYDLSILLNFFRVWT